MICFLSLNAGYMRLPLRGFLNEDKDTLSWAWKGQEDTVAEAGGAS